MSTQNDKEEAPLSPEMDARLEELRTINRELHRELIDERRRRQAVADDAQSIILEYAEQIEKLKTLIDRLQGR
tara:strand:+ start:1172 stop:1390 length:219 start_codon:yes stop_codon:yes gene_type:complete